MKIVLFVFLLISFALCLHVVQEYKVTGATKLMFLKGRGNGMFSAFSPPSQVKFFKDLFQVTEFADFNAPCENVVGSMADYFSEDTLLYNTTTTCYFHERFNKRYVAKIPFAPLAQRRHFTYYVKNDSSISEYSWQHQEEIRVINGFKSKPLFMSVDYYGINGFVASSSKLYRISLATASIRSAIDFSSFTPIQVIAGNLFVHVLGESETGSYKLKHYYSTNMIEFGETILDKDIEKPKFTTDGADGYAYVLARCKKNEKQKIFMFNLQSQELVDELAFENAAPTELIASPMFVYLLAQDPARVIKVSKF